SLLREAGRPFSPADVAFVDSLSELLADGLRGALVRSGMHSGVPPREAGVVLVAGDGSVEHASPAALQLAGELESAAGDAGELPLVIHVVAGHARDAAARAHVRTRAGRWLLVHGAPLGDGRTAVILEDAVPADVAPLVASAHGLTPRER